MMTDHAETFPKEKRRSPRVSGAVVEYHIEGEESDKRKAFIKDICIHGVCIYIPNPVAENSILCMDIYLFGSETPIFTKGRVVWQRLGGYFSFHNVGIEFTEINDEDAKKLEEHISANYKGEERGTQDQ